MKFAKSLRKGFFLNMLLTEKISSKESENQFFSRYFMFLQPTYKL